MDTWRIDESYTWPPEGRPTPPLTPSLWRLVRQCGLRATFHASSHYPRRSLPSQRIGIAVHRTLGRLVTADTLGSNVEDFARWGLAVFREHLGAERALAIQAPRERHLRWPDNQVVRAENAIIIAARRVWAAAHDKMQDHIQGRGASPSIERQLYSRDGLLSGIPDWLDHTGQGVRVVEYKIHRAPTEEDVAEHTEQVIFYAYLVFDALGKWPEQGLIVYLVAGREIRVPIDPERSTSLAEQARLVARALVASPEHVLRPNPGPHCADCEFRPWCRPFWEYQANRARRAGLAPEAESGVEGSVTTVRLGTGVVLIELATAGPPLIMRLPLGQFAHASNVQPGTRLRVLDTSLTGSPDKPAAMVREYSEVYLVS